MSLLPTITSTNVPPSAQINFDSANLNAAVSTITAYRTVDGITTTVRSAIRLFATGGVSFIDHEIPIGVPVTYQVQQYNSSGTALGYTDPAVITVPTPGPLVAWVTDPLDATQAVRVILSDAAGRRPSRPVPGTLHRIGRRTVALVGQRGLMEQLNMDFYTETEADRDAIDALLDQSGGLLLIRTAPPVPVPRLLYVWAPNAVPEDFDPTGEEGTIWTNTVDEVSPAEGPLVRGAATWQLYMDAFPTWGDMDAAYTTWLDAMKNPPS